MAEQSQARNRKTFARFSSSLAIPLRLWKKHFGWRGNEMKILKSWPQVDGIVRYLLRDGYGVIAVDVEGNAMTGFTHPGYKGDEDKALKRAFKFLE